ncbi:centromere protein J-like [Homarus americanus]|uniref:centromere protein J-like n=1 Tax=Homarus americanus TaxID=6706 RepID=UPI001C46232E|nr:centromere protein J-like [Homarus americanus]
MKSIFYVLRFISVFSIQFEMENEECDVFTLERERNLQDPQKPSPDINIPVQSPSQNMLERLKELRKWQEMQREKLATVQSYNLVAASSTSKSQLLEEAASNFHFKSQPPKYSVLSQAEKTNESDALSTLPPSGVLPAVKVKENHTVEEETCLDGYTARHVTSQDAVNVCHNTSCTDELPEESILNIGISQRCLESSSDQNIPEICNTGFHNEHQKLGDTRSQLNQVKDIAKYNSAHESVNVQSCLSQDKSSLCDNSVSEQILDNQLEREVMYESQKYGSNPKFSACFSKINVDKNASNFIIPASSCISKFIVEPDTKPKPKHRYLRKGEGTARFSMKPIRLKKTKASIDERNINVGSTIQKQENIDVNNQEFTSVKTSVANGQVVGSYLRKTGNRPISKLQLKNVPEPIIPKSRNKIDRTDHTVSQEERCYPTFSERHELVTHCPNLQFDKQSRKERDELSAFEKLEELADDSSFSSNSSTVWQLLQRGQHSATSTPLRSSPPIPSRRALSDNYSDQEKFKKYGQECSNVCINLLDRIQKPSVDNGESSSQRQQVVLNMSQVLEQLRAIVKLEELNVSEAEIQTFLESFSDQHTSISHEMASQFATSMWPAFTNPTSTPAPWQSQPQLKPHVHFRDEGVEVLEYELSESDREDTLTDTPSIIVDDSDLVTTSDLEALVHFNAQQLLKNMPHTQMADLNHENNQFMEIVETDDSKTCSSECSASSDDTLTEPQLEKGVQPIALQFSPPPQRKPGSASDYIQSIFGKDRNSPKKLDPPKIKDKTKKDNVKPHHEVKYKEAKTVAAVPNQKEEQDFADSEVDTYKTLLLAKVCELEKETKIFKKENSKLQKLQHLAVEEKKQLDDEKLRLHEEIAREKKRLKDHIDRERNAIWKEKQELKQLTPSITMAKNNSLEVVYLKEQIQDLHEEAKKKESLNQYSMKKLNDRIKLLEEENRQLKEKALYVQNLEKENLELKHKLDRTKLGEKKAVVDHPKNTARGKLKPKPKSTIVDGVSRSLNKLVKSKGRGTMAINEYKNDDCDDKHVESGQETGQHKINLPSFVSTDVDQVGRTRNEGITASFENVEKNFDDMILTGSGTGTRVGAHTGAFQQQNVDKRQGNMPAGTSVNEAQNLVEPKKAFLPTEDKSMDFTESYRDDGTKEIIYANGNKKEIYPNGVIYVSYYNGDRKEIHGDRTVYIYGTDRTSHTTFNDGKEVLVFPNGQKETRLPDGSSEIIFTDNSRKIALQDGTEMCIMKDGTVVRSNPDGSKVFEFVSGQREIHTNAEKRREYPDGTVKILHQDGKTETRYKTGRTRIKDCQGNIILDSH